MDVEIRNRMRKISKYRRATYIDDDFVKEYPKIRQILKKFRAPRTPREKANISTSEFRYFDLVYIRNTVAMSKTFSFYWFRPCARDLTK